MNRWLVLTACLLTWLPLQAQELQVVQLYTQDELLDLIKHNKHLQRVQADDCQLVNDIQARADVMHVPAYQFLFGDMLAYGVCVKKDVERGWDLMQKAAAQGLPEALEQIGRYYHTGKFVQKDLNKAVMYTREAAILGNLNAQLRFGRMLVDGQASPVDMEQAYHLLHFSVVADEKIHAQIAQLLAALAEKMPASAVQKAKKPL